MGRSSNFFVFRRRKRFFISTYQLTLIGVSLLIIVYFALFGKHSKPEKLVRKPVKISVVPQPDSKQEENIFLPLPELVIARNPTQDEFKPLKVKPLHKPKVIEEVVKKEVKLPERTVPSLTWPEDRSRKVLDYVNIWNISPPMLPAAMLDFSSEQGLLWIFVMSKPSNFEAR